MAAEQEQDEHGGQITQSAPQEWVSYRGYVVRQAAMNVYDAALERIRHAFATHETVVVSFSGGKDSTVVLELSLHVARELNRLPLAVWMFDDEIIDPDTTAHAASVALRPDVTFRHYCLPIRHTLRSQHRTHWYTWDPDERHVWARELPPDAITHVDGWTKGDGGIADACVLIFRHERDSLPDPVMLAGIRVEESLNRRRSLLTAGDWLSDRGSYAYGKPVYDWTWRDVWKAIREHGWAYSAYYDRLYTEGSRAPREQRVAPWGNVASAREARLWAACYADFYDRALYGGDIRPLFTALDVFGEKQFSVHFVNRLWAQYHPEQARAFVAGIVDAIAWIEANQDEARPIIAAHTGIDPANVPDYHFQEGGRVVEDDVQWWLDYLLARGDVTADWLLTDQIASNVYNAALSTE